jgi:site-specific DNA-methyltransferase (adenine-specific)
LIVERGTNRFVNADCVSGALHYLADASVDLIVTDPPYGIGGDGLHKHYNRDERFVVEGYVEVPAPRYAHFSRAWIAQAERVLRPGGQIYVVSGYTNLPDVLNALRETSLREVNHIIWKYNFGVYTSRKFVSSHYHILYYAKPGLPRTFNLECRFARDERADGGGSSSYRDREDVWTINREYKPGRKKNKNELPLALLQKMLLYSSNEGDLVCDFFMGGGSTAIACIGLNRRFAGFELSPQMFRTVLEDVDRAVPGGLLSGLAKRGAVVENRGKRWSPGDVRAVLRRYEELAATGAPKRRIVDALGTEFGRGPWAIGKVIKDRA